MSIHQGIDTPLDPPTERPRQPIPLAGNPLWRPNSWPLAINLLMPDNRCAQAVYRWRDQEYIYFDLWYGGSTISELMKVRATH